MEGEEILRSRDLPGLVVPSGLPHQATHSPRLFLCLCPLIHWPLPPLATLRGHGAKGNIVGQWRRVALANFFEWIAS